MEKEKKFVPRKARLKIVYEYPFKDVAIICRQCARAPCAEQCKVGAIKRDDRTGAWIIDSNKCIECGVCVEACPFGIIALSDDNVAFKCDLCCGDPKCVSWCPTTALKYESRTKIGERNREEFAKKYAFLLQSQRYRI